MQRLFRVLMVGAVLMAIATALTAGGSSPVSAGEPIVCVTATPPTGVTDTPTNTPTNTVTNTPTDTPTNTVTNTPTDTPTNTPTSTPTEEIILTQLFGGLASVGGQGNGLQNTARLGVVPTCTPTPTSTPTDTATAVDTATSITEPSVTATLGGATDVPATETPEIQLPNTGSGSGSTNPFAIMALLLLAACGVVWGINRRTRNT